MAEHTPLDAGVSFEPSSDDRPAGEWMETYWRQAVPWAKRFAFAVWAYVALQVYATSQTTLVEGAQFLGFLLGAALVHVPVVALGYFSFRFGSDLEKALASGEQFFLESAFRQLHRALLLGILIAGLWLLSAAYGYYATTHLFGQDTLLQSQ